MSQVTLRFELLIVTSHCFEACHMPLCCFALHCFTLHWFALMFTVCFNLFCFGSEPVDINSFTKQVLVYNKVDCLPYTGKNKNVFTISATTGKGLTSLTRRIEREVGFLGGDASEPLLTTIRQKEAMLEISSCLSRAIDLFVNNNQTIELPAQEIKNAIVNIDLFTGKTTTNDILDRVFSTFCVGK